MEQLKQLLTAAGIAYKENEPLAAHCTFKIGGPARLFVQPIDHAQLCRTVALCKAQGVRYYLLGNGSNILFADEGYNGVQPEIQIALLDVLGRHLQLAHRRDHTPINPGRQNTAGHDKNEEHHKNDVNSQRVQLGNGFLGRRDQEKAVLRAV